MKRTIGILAVAIASLALVSQSADARGRGHHRHSHRLAAVTLGVGAASTLTFLSLNGWTFNRHVNSNGLTTLGAATVTTVGCAAVTPIVATAVLRRPLTMREGHTVFAGCVLPIIGPWLVDAAYDAHPEWTK